MQRQRLPLIHLAVFAALSITAPSVVADSSHAVHGAGAMATEPGQGAFGALIEIVEILEKDPKTDWQRVDIAALREHLVDMSALVLHAAAAETHIDGGIRAEVTASGRALAAVQRMVPAHAQVLDAMGRWSARAETTETGAVLVVAATDPGEVARVRALGFFGIMATGAHHQAHHLAMARGQPVHGAH